MKKLTYIFSLILFLSFGVTLAGNNEDIIKNTSDQINYLIQRNSDSNVSKKWYVVFLGSTTEDLKYYIHESTIKENFSDGYLEALNDKLAAINSNKSLKTAIYTVITDGSDVSLSFFPGDLNLKDTEKVDDYLELMLGSKNKDTIRLAEQDKMYWKFGRAESRKKTSERANKVLDSIFKDSKLYSQEETNNVLLCQYYFNVLKLKNTNNEKAQIWSGIFYTKKLLPKTPFDSKKLHNKYTSSSFSLGNSNTEKALAKYVDAWESYLKSPSGEITFDYTDNYNLKIENKPNDTDLKTNKNAKVFDFCGALSPINYSELNKQLANTPLINDYKMYLFFTDNNTSETILNEIEKYKEKKDIIFLWVHKKSDEELQFTTIAPDEYNKLVADIFAWNSLSPLQKLLSSAKDAGTEIARNLGEGFSELGGLISNAIKYAKLPEAFYNKCHENFVFKGYEDLVEKLWVNPATNQTTFSIDNRADYANILLEKFKISSDCSIDVNNSFDRAMLRIAFTAGFWNGAVDVIADIPQSLDLINYLINPDKHKELGELYDKMQAEGAWGQLFDAVNDSFDKAHSLKNIYLFSEQIGYDIAYVASFAIAFTKVGQLAKINRILEALDATTYLFKAIGKGFEIVKRVGSKGQKIIEIFDDATKKVIYKIEEIGNRLLLKYKDVQIGFLTEAGEIISLYSDEIIGFIHDSNIFIKNNLFSNTISSDFKLASIIAPNGKFYRLDASATLDNIKSNVDNFSKKIENKITVYKDKANNIAYKLDDAASIFDYAKNKLDGIDLTNKVKKSIAKKIEDLDLPVDKVDEFIKDLKNNSNFRDAIVGDVDLVDSWKILNDAKRVVLKLDSDVLTKLNKVLQNKKLDEFLPINTVKRNITNKTELVEQIVKLQDEAGSMVGKRMSGMGDLMDELDYFLINFADKPGAIEFIKELSESGGKMAGGSFVLKTLKNNSDELGKVVKFESTVASKADDIGDIVVDVISDKGVLKNVFNEFKNWRSVTIIRYSSFSKQFTGYLSNKNIGEFSYFFNKGVEGNGFNNFTELKDQVMNAFSSSSGRAELSNIPLSRIKEIVSNPKLLESQKVQTLIDYIDDLENFESIFKLIE